MADLSRARFCSMEAAFKAGHADLAEHVATRQSARRGRPLPRAMADIRLPSVRPGPAGTLDNDYSDVMDGDWPDDEHLTDRNI